MPGLSFQFSLRLLFVNVKIGIIAVGELLKKNVVSVTLQEKQLRMERYGTYLELNQKVADM